MKSLLKEYTCGNGKLMLAPIIWAFFETLTTMFPAMLAMLAMGELIKVFFTEQTFDINFLWACCIAMVIAMILQGIISIAAYNNSYCTSQKAMARMRRGMIEKIRNMPMGDLEEKESGDYSNAFVTDPNSLDQAIAFFIPQILSMGLVTVFSIVVLFIYDWRLALPMYICLPICLLLMKIAMKLRYKQSEQVSNARIRSTTLLNEYLLGMKNLKSYNQTGSGFTKLANAYETLCKATTKEEGLPGAITLLAGHMIQFGVPLIIFTGSMLLLNGGVDIFMLLAFLIISTKLYSPLITSIICMISLKASKIAASRINNLLGAKEQAGSQTHVKSGDITLQNVSFGYDKNRTIINNVSFTAREGELTALVGASGSGKTTLLRLIARFWDTDSGEILLGDQIISNVQTDALFSQISIVFQDNYLFGDSIRNNILFGRSDKTEEDMVAAAKKACCHDFICDLPDGYDTVIGEGGATLSGGERQRIAIARAILKDAPILLLDEPTSNLDAWSESQIQKAIDELVKNKTVIMIAHKLKTIANANQIVILEQGKVIQNGIHDNLITETSGLYCHLWDLQTKAQQWNIKNDA